MDAARPCLALLLALLSACGVDEAPAPSTPAPGAFDLAYGSQGIVVVDPPAGSRSYAAAVAIDSQGRAVAAGSEVPLDFHDLRYRPLFARFTREGTLDPSWAGGGIFRPPDDPAIEREGTYVTALSDDRTVLGERLAIRCGSPGQPACGPSGQVNDFFAQRHAPDGSVDPSYGVMSTVSIAVTRPAVVSFGGGALATFGVTNLPTPGGPGLRTVFQARRVDDRGQLEMGYALAAEAALMAAFGGAVPDIVRAVPAGEGRVVVAASVSYRIVVARLAADGSIDRTFATQGVLDPATRPLSGFGQILQHLVPRPSGGVAILYALASPVPTAGYTGTMVAWIGADGRPEGAADVPIDPLLVGDVQAAASMPDGRLLVAGFPLIQAPPVPGRQPDYAHPRVAAIDRAGQPDPAFGPAGLGYAPLESAGRTLGPRHMVRAPDGSLYVAGTVPADVTGLARTSFGLAKLGS